MKRRRFLEVLGFAAPVGVAAAALTTTPVFGVDDAGQDVISIPVILTKDEVRTALAAGRLPGLLRDKAASVHPAELACHLVTSGWIERPNVDHGDGWVEYGRIKMRS